MRVALVNGGHDAKVPVEVLPMSTSARSTLPPAVKNGILRADQLPPVRPLPDDPATRDQRYLELAAMLEEWARDPLEGEPEWDVETLFPPDRSR